MDTRPHITSSKPVVPLPDSSLSKRDQVAGMFDRISGKYDFLNHFFSMGIDRYWRKCAIRTLAPIKPQKILDIATGTGDLAIEALRLHPESVIGVDISEGMLAIGREKVAKLRQADTIQLQYGDSAALAFADDSFDALTCAYGVRNFESPERGLAEMTRVLRPGGRIAILEFSMPKTFPVKQFYRFYFRYILPALGKAVSKDQTAYQYLPESVAAFPEGEAFCNLLRNTGLKNVNAKPMAFGITTLYTAEK